MYNDYQQNSESGRKISSNSIQTPTTVLFNPPKRLKYQFRVMPRTCRGWEILDSLISTAPRSLRRCPSSSHTKPTVEYCDLPFSSIIISLAALAPHCTLLHPLTSQRLGDSTLRGISLERLSQELAVVPTQPWVDVGIKVGGDWPVVRE